MKIVVLGAYGYTGQLICEELIASGCDFVLGGRSSTRLEALAERLPKKMLFETIDIKNKNEVEELVACYDIFVNCIGPYAESADLILEQVAQKKKIYLDLTGESFFVRQSHARLNLLAQKNKALILHSCAFESVLADLLGTMIIEDPKQVKSVQSFYHLGKAKPSPGTRLTMKLARLHNPYFMEAGQLQQLSAIQPRPIEFENLGSFTAIPYPLPEIWFFNWTTSAQTIGSFLLVDPLEAQFSRMNNIPSKGKEEILTRFKSRKIKGPTKSQRETQSFTIIVEVKEDLRTKRIQLSGFDMYQLTAKIVAFFIEKLKEVKKYGVLSPSQFLGDNHNFFEVLQLEPLLIENAQS